MGVDLGESPGGVRRQVAVFEELHAVPGAGLAPGFRAELTDRLQFGYVDIGHSRFSLASRRHRGKLETV